MTTVVGIRDNNDRALDDPRDIQIYHSQGTTYAAVVSNDKHGIQILNMSDHANVSAAGRYLDSSVLTDPIRLAVYDVGQNVYAIIMPAQLHDRIAILDITDPTNISHVSTIGSSAGINNAAEAITFDRGSRTYAMVFNHVNPGILIFDVTDPTSPSPVSGLRDNSSLTLDRPNFADIYTVGPRTYAAVVSGSSSSNSGIQIIDITDLGNPIPAGQLLFNNSNFRIAGVNAIDIYESGGRKLAAVTAGNSDNVQVVDITNPYAPRPGAFLISSSDRVISQTPGTLDLSGIDDATVAEIGGRFYAIAASPGQNVVHIIDVTDPDSLGLAMKFTRNGNHFNGAQAVGVAVIDDVAYAAIPSRWSDSVQIIKIVPPPVISSPAGPHNSFTHAKPVPFSILFDEPVQDFLTDDIDVAGSAGATQPSSFSGSGAGPYHFSAIPSQSGTVTINVGHGSTNPIKNSPYEFVMNYVAPNTPLITSPDVAEGSTMVQFAAAPVRFSVSFGTTVSGFTATDVVVGGSAQPGPVTNFAGSGAGPYTFSVVPERAGTISISIPENVTNPDNAAAEFEARVGSPYVPQISWSGGSTVQVDQPNSVSFSVRFMLPVTGFAASDIAVGGTSNPGSVSNFNGSGAGPYTFDVAPSRDGTITIDVPRGSTVPANLGAAASVNVNLTYLAANWSSKLTVAETSPGTYYGCHNPNPNAADRCSTLLTEPQFILDGTKYTIKSMYHDKVGSDCVQFDLSCSDGDDTNNKEDFYIEFEPVIGTGIRDYTLSVDGIMLNFGSAVQKFKWHDVGPRLDKDFPPTRSTFCPPIPPGANSIYCPGTPLQTIPVMDWSVGDTVRLSLTEAAVRAYEPAPGSGIPDIGEYEARLSVYDLGTTSNYHGYGCSHAVGNQNPKKCDMGKLLDNRQFTLDGTTYTVTAIIYNHVQKNLMIATSPDLPDSLSNYKLVIESSEFVFHKNIHADAPANPPSGTVYYWQGVSFLKYWTGTPTVSISIVERPPPREAPVTVATPLRLLSASSTTVTEGTDISVTVRLAQPAQENRTLCMHYSPTLSDLADDTVTHPNARHLMATPASDYFHPLLEQVIPKGQRTVSFEIQTQDDAIPESDEGFSLRVSCIPQEAFPRNGADVYQISSLTFTIRDND